MAAAAAEQLPQVLLFEHLLSIGKAQRAATERLHTRRPRGRLSSVAVIAETLNPLPPRGPPRHDQDHLSGDELREALLRTASGVYTSEAAIGLLVAHGSWPLRLEGAGLITVSEATTAAGSNSCYAEVLWEEAIATIEAGNMSWGSGSEIRVLRIAASLATGIPVDLGDAVTGLDLVLAALSHANGSHEHKDYAAERPTDATPVVITADTPLLTLGPVFGWPH